MESKYKERAEEILFKEHTVGINKDGECFEHNSIFIETMCQLAEEVKDEYKKRYKEFEDLAISLTVKEMGRDEIIVNNYAELSWKIEELANSRDTENGISTSHFRELVREILHDVAKEAFNVSREYDLHNTYKYENFNEYLKNKENES